MRWRSTLYPIARLCISTRFPGTFYRCAENALFWRLCDFLPERQLYHNSPDAGELWSELPDAGTFTLELDPIVNVLSPPLDRQKTRPMTRLNYPLPPPSRQ